MTRFVDVYAPCCMRPLEKPIVAGPRWNTTILATAGGDERANQNWENPLWSFTLPEAARHQPDFEDIMHFWLGMGGPFHTFPWRNPLDFASTGLPRPNVAPTVSHTDQVLGTGDGVTTTFQLRKVYTYESLSYTRTVHLPVVETILIGIDGALQSGSPAGYDISRPGGEVTFDTPPANGAALTWGGLFDIEARFADDRAFQGVIRGKKWSGFPDVNLEEVRPC